MKYFILCFTVGAFILTGCNKGTENKEHQIVVSFTIKSLSSSLLKSTGSTDENAIGQILVFGVNDKNGIVQTFPVIDKPQLTGTSLSVLGEVKSLYVIANPSVNIKSQNPKTVNDLMAMTCDYGQTPQSPFTMSAAGEIRSSSISLELVRSVAKINVTGDDGFEVLSVTVMNTPVKGFVFSRTPLVVPTATRSNYAENSNTTIYVTENTREDPTSLLVKGKYQGLITENIVEFKVAGNPVDVVRNTSYQVTIAPVSGSVCNISVSIREWNDIDLDTLYFED